MHFRHEMKHEIGYGDLLALRSRLSATMRSDAHAKAGAYRVRSLYFDNFLDKALHEKIDGVNDREKFRIRLYDCDDSFIHLEKKSKVNGLCNKQQCRLSADETQALAEGRTSDVRAQGRPLLEELLWKMANQLLQPMTIVDYAREPFVYRPGNVRVTLDYDIRTGMHRTDLLNPACPLVPVRGEPILLEVKWDDFLPSFVRDVVQIPTTRTVAFSKYAACRVYG